MGFDWNYLFDLKVDELSDENVESLYDQLIQVLFLNYSLFKMLYKGTEYCFIS